MDDTRTLLTRQGRHEIDVWGYNWTPHGQKLNRNTHDTQDRRFRGIPVRWGAICVLSCLSCSFFFPFFALLDALVEGADADEGDAVSDDTRVGADGDVSMSMGMGMGVMVGYITAPYRSLEYADVDADVHVGNENGAHRMAADRFSLFSSYSFFSLPLSLFFYFLSLSVFPGSSGQEATR